jgi:hypothetical protein
MAAAAGAWLLETMNDCAYAEHVADELEDLEKRLAQGRASGADVYLLRNVAVLIDCALRDFGVYDAGRRSRNTKFDRNCMLSEARARELQDWVAVTVGDLGGAERGAKKARTDAVLQGGGRELLQMSALLAQMRA